MGRAFSATRVLVDERQQLWDTTMDPENRMMCIHIEDAEEADRTFKR
jgi:DNA gyrase/topoisomerase IV subunit B